MSGKREYGFDNIRCILIFLMVFGHLLSPSGLKSTPYFTIYTFHMPVFLFLSGWFARPKPREIRKYAVLLVCFQIVYSALDFILTPETFKLELLTPTWHLWYLLVLIYYKFLLPRIDYPPALIVSIAVSLLVGYFKKIGFTLSLSRFFVFLPYFILGHQMRSRKEELKAALSGPKTILLLAAGLLLSYELSKTRLPSWTLFGAYSYQLQYTAVTRLLLYLLGIVWCLAFFALAMGPLDRRLPLITKIGQNTLLIYLLHGIPVKLLRHFEVLPKYPGNLLPAAVLALILVLLLGFLPAIKKRETQKL